MLPQRWHGDRDDIEPIVQILSKLSGLDGLFKIFVGCRKNASFEGDRMSSTYPFELPLLQDAQELGLHGRRELANLIEKHGSVIRSLKFPFSHSDCAGVRAFFVPEELSFQKCFGNCCAVDGDEGEFASRTALMDRTCDDFLAGAAFSPD